MKRVIEIIKKAQECLEEAWALAEEDNSNIEVIYSLLVESLYNIKKVTKEIDLKR